MWTLQIALLVLCQPHYGWEAKQVACSKLFSLHVPPTQALVWSEDSAALYVQTNSNTILRVEKDKLTKALQLRDGERLIGATRSALYFFSRATHKIWREQVGAQIRFGFLNLPREVKSVEYFSLKKNLVVSTLNASRSKWPKVLDYLKATDLRAREFFEYRPGYPSTIWSVDVSSRRDWILVQRNGFGANGLLSGATLIDLHTKSVIFDPIPLDIDGYKAVSTVFPPSQLRFILDRWIARFLITGTEEFWSNLNRKTGSEVHPLGSLLVDEGHLDGSRLEMWLADPGTGNLWFRVTELPHSRFPDCVSVALDQKHIAFVCGSGLYGFKLSIPK